MKKCMKCGCEYTDDVRFCGNCGNVFSSQNYQVNNSQNNRQNQQVYQNRQNDYQQENYSVPVYCKRCGGWVDVNIGFCSKCGQPAGYHYSDDSYGKKKKNSSLTVIIVILLIILLTCTAVFGYIFFFNTPDNDSDVFMDDNEKKESLADYGKDDENEPVKPPEDEDDVDVEIISEDEEDTEEEGEEITENDSEYLFPSNSKYITEYDLDSRSKHEIALIRNEIYARHGYIFETEYYREYFESKDWYVPNPGFTESLFNKYEKENKSFIVEYEKKKGWR